LTSFGAQRPPAPCRTPPPAWSAAPPACFSAP
jgi:hypothetical protein